MSQSNENEGDTTPDNGTGADAIGIYYVRSEDLIKEPNERTYLRCALWTAKGWAPTSNSGFVERAPATQTIDDFRNTFAARNFIVMSPESVPGTVEIKESDHTVEDMDIDVPVIEDAYTQSKIG